MVVDQAQVVSGVVPATPPRESEYRVADAYLLIGGPISH